MGRDLVSLLRYATSTRHLSPSHESTLRRIGGAGKGCKCKRQTLSAEQDALRVPVRLPWHRACWCGGFCIRSDGLYHTPQPGIDIQDQLLTTGQSHGCQIIDTLCTYLARSEYREQTHALLRLILWQVRRRGLHPEVIATVAAACGNDYLGHYSGMRSPTSRKPWPDVTLLVPPQEDLKMREKLSLPQAAPRSKRAERNVRCKDADGVAGGLCMGVVDRSSLIVLHIIPRPTELHGTSRFCFCLGAGGGYCSLHDQLAGTNFRRKQCTAVSGEEWYVA